MLSTKTRTDTLTKTRANPLKAFNRITELGVLASLVVVCVAFTILTDGQFATLGNAAALLAQAAELGIVTIGIAFILISGEIDLSVGSVYGMSALFFVFFSSQVGSVASFFIALGVACLAGLCNGLITLKTGVPSLIVTLGMQMFVRGIIYFTTQGFTLNIPTDFLTNILAGNLVGDFLISIVWFILLVVIFTIVLRFTRYGNALFAVGGNKEVARAMGINVDRIKLTNFILCAGLAGLAGTISASRFHTVAATTGVGVELEAIAAAVIGGCLITGGYGSVIGASLGALLIPAVSAGLIMGGAPSYWYQAFVGVVLVAAAVINLVVVRRTLKA
jgi:simple sugar transport system permease protein